MLEDLIHRSLPKGRYLVTTKYFVLKYLDYVSTKITMPCIVQVLLNKALTKPVSMHYEKYIHLMQAWVPQLMTKLLNLIL